MNKFRLVLVISAIAAVSACDDEAYRDPPTAPPPAPAAVEDAPPAQPDADTAAQPPAPTVDRSQLPPPPESSEESVQPESETLFY